MNRASYEVVVATPCWKVNGANTYSANLVRGLRQAGLAAHLLITHPPPQIRNVLPVPADVPHDTLPVRAWMPWERRWRILRDYLERHTPCVYVPNNDYRHSCIAPTLPPEVAIAGILHSDSPEHYGDLERMGPYWNAAVAVSQAIHDEALRRQPSIESRLHTIYCGVAIPPWDELPARDALGPLRLIYAGRLDQHQKRVLDLALLLDALETRAIPVQLDVYGDGPQKSALRRALGRHATAGTAVLHGAVSNARILDAYAVSDVFVLPSAFEGLPVALLEAMSRACVPVVTDIRSGIPEAVRDGHSGFVVPAGDMALCAERIAALHADRGLRGCMARAAYDAVAAGPFGIAAMAQHYMRVFEEMWRAIDAGAYRRPAGPIAPPPFLKPVWRCYMPAWMKRTGG